MGGRGEFAVGGGEFGFGMVGFVRIWSDLVRFGGDFGGWIAGRLELFKGGLVLRRESFEPGFSGFVDLGPAHRTVGVAAAVFVPGVTVGAGAVGLAAAGKRDRGGGLGVCALALRSGLELGERAEQEPEFARGGDVLLVLLGFLSGLDQLLDLVDQLLGDEGLEDVLAVELEVAQVGGDGRVGAAEFGGDLPQAESLAAEPVGLEDALAASWRGRVGHGGLLGLR